ncbi:glycosyl transferase family 2, partial [Flavobacterium sp. FPG59]
VVFFTCYWFTYKKIYGGGFVNFIKYIGLFFTFYSIAMGFTFHNTIAVVQGLIGKKSDFIRTPKFNIESLKEKWKQNTYINKKISKNIIIESLLLLYFLFGIYSGIQLNDYGLLPFHIMLSFGYGFVIFNSFRIGN